MANAYNSPELYNHYCCNLCAIGNEYMPKLDVNELDLFRIADDGIVSEEEAATFSQILASLDSLAARTTALKLWAHKNFK